jgi:hypothetical protein
MGRYPVHQQGELPAGQRSNLAGSARLAHVIRYITRGTAESAERSALSTEMHLTLRGRRCCAAERTLPPFWAVIGMLWKSLRRAQIGLFGGGRLFRVSSLGQGVPAVVERLLTADVGAEIAAAFSVQRPAGLPGTGRGGRAGVRPAWPGAPVSRLARAGHGAVGREPGRVLLGRAARRRALPGARRRQVAGSGRGHG